MIPDIFQTTQLTSHARDEQLQRLDEAKYLHYAISRTLPTLLNRIWITAVLVNLKTASILPVHFKKITLRFITVNAFLYLGPRPFTSCSESARAIFKKHCLAPIASKDNFHFMGISLRACRARSRGFRSPLTVLVK